MSSDPDWLKKLFPNASYDLETLIGREIKFTKQGARMRFDELGHPIVDKQGNPMKERKVKITKEMIANNRFYIGSDQVFNKPSGGWGHPTIEEAQAQAQEMLRTREDLEQVFIVEIKSVVRRKPIEVVIETV